MGLKCFKEVSIMPVPKRRLGRSRQGHRRSYWKATEPTLVTCSNCGSPRMPHTLCGVCGHYKGVLVTQRYNKAGL
jgi:large subunit ribosomal protein L32